MKLQSTACALACLAACLLHAAPDQSVTVVVIGGQTCIHRLLLSPTNAEGDGSIGRTGRELVAAKVRELIIMGGNFVENWPYQGLGQAGMVWSGEEERGAQDAWVGEGRRVVNGAGLAGEGVWVRDPCSVCTFWGHQPGDQERD